MAIILSGNITVDESGNLQNANATPDIPEDSNDNDITVAAINDNDDTGDLPFAFESRLYELGISGVPANTALSGYSGAAGNTGADLITITNDYIDLAFTDAQGKPLGDPTNANAGSDWSGLYTLDGRKIFLYTDITNNIVLGRTGDEGATPAPEDDLANPDGTIVFAAYLEETATGAKVWMVQQEPLKHPNTSNPDDVVDMTDHLWVTASQDAAFDFAGLPSGENDFLMFKAGSSNVGLVVTGMDPDRVDAAGKDVGDNVSTSQGGGGTTIGTNNQAVNPGEGMIFTFVTDPNALYTVPNLTPTEANVEGNIDFGGLFGATGATFVIAQQTPPKASTARISVYTTDFEETTGYFEGLLDADDNLGYIASVTVRDANGDVIAGLDGVTTNTTVGNISVTFTLSNGGADRTATIAGFESNYSLEYTTSELHNRVMIENIGNAAQKLNSPFDIGGFHLPNIVAVPQEIGSQVNFEDDGPSATLATLAGTVDEDGVVEGTANAGPGDGIAGGTGDVTGEAVVASGTVSTLFASGADQPLSYSLTTNGLTALGLKSGGVTVTYAVAYDAVANTHTLTASAGVGNTVFTFSVHAATGAYTFTLVDQLDHASLDGLTGDNTENDLSIALGTAINATDADGDTVTAAANGLVITVDDDTPIATVATLAGTVDEDGVVEGTANAGPGDGIAGGTDDVTGEVVVASGTVSTLFQSGADEPLSYSLTTNGLTALGLKSGGVTVTYAVAYDAVANTHTLTASAGAGNTVFTFSVHAATGAYTFTLVDQLDHASLDGLTGDNTENDLSIALGTAINATDADGDTVTAAANGLVITVDDDTPIATVATLTGTVDEDGVVEGEADAGRGDGIASGPGDVAGEAVTASGTVSTLFQSGADEALSYSLTTNGLTALGLKSGGVTVTYAVAYDADTKTHTLTASAPAGNTVFTFSVHGESGAYTFTLVDQLDHASLDGLTGDNTENDLSIALGTAINATDFDGDSVTAAGNGLVITVDDDSPVVTAKSNLVYANSSNPTPGGTGVFAYDIGADERLSYSATNADLSVSLTGVSVGTNDITNKSVTWFSENDTSAVFNIAFTYVSNNPTQGALTNATGTLTFNKVADTYTLSLTDEIESFSILRTSTAQGFTGYAINGTTPINQQPPVSVAELADDFFVQFTGFAEEGGGTGANNIKAGGDNIFVNDSDDGNELFSAATSWVSVSGTAAGVAGDTIQQGEVMDLDFFAANPFGITSATPTATSKGVFVKFDGIGNEDLVLVLKLIDPDDQSQITRAIIVDSQDIILKTASTSPNNFHPIANPAAYGIVLDQNDGAVIIESNDYNFGTTENYVIEGLQVLVSTEGVVGTGYNLNGNVGVNGASNGTSLAFGDVAGEGGKSNPLEAGEAASWDGDVVKIVDMGFVTSATPDALLTFDVVVTDADGDSTGTQTLNVTIDGDNGVGADTFNFSGLDTDVLLSGATDVISIGFVSGVDKLDFPTAGSGSNYAEELTPATNLAGFISAADTALNGTTDYYFGVVGGDGYLAFDGDGSGITNIIQLVGVTDIAFTDIV
ncbi:DUF5801 repeats-in-toxin domain-containing protein [Pseudomonas sp. FW300-N1B4]|uniref:beta strand repeat-containing protein n=1 Tax=Pseudomonas sp. FW300-N1B4 TaxID=2751315 RepID=UPI001C665B70|nr:DUF5801 repeats-in-toxin domain-containing protein [Pseudomonas sp. FW300-N1B4]